MTTKASDEWLAIGSGIGFVVLLFAIYNRAKKGGQSNSASPAETPPSIDYPAYTGALTPNEAQALPAFYGTTFNPPVDNITIGPTTIEGDSFTIGANLFPLFGYAVQNNGLSQVYRVINELMQNNANYQAGQNAVQLNYLVGG